MRVAPPLVSKFEDLIYRSAHSLAFVYFILFLITARAADTYAHAHGKQAHYDSDL